MLRTMKIAFYAPGSQVSFKLLMEIVIGIDSKSMMEGLQQKMDKLGWGDKNGPFVKRK